TPEPKKPVEPKPIPPDAATIPNVVLPPGAPTKPSSGRNKPLEPKPTSGRNKPLEPVSPVAGADLPVLEPSANLVAPKLPEEVASEEPTPKSTILKSDTQPNEPGVDATAVSKPPVMVDDAPWADKLSPVDFRSGRPPGSPDPDASEEPTLPGFGIAAL